MLKQSENIRNGYSQFLSDDSQEKKQRQLINFIARGKPVSWPQLL